MLPRTFSGWLWKYSLMLSAPSTCSGLKTLSSTSWSTSSRSRASVSIQRVMSSSIDASKSLRRNTRMSVTTSVPATRLKAVDGRRTAPTSSACSAMARRARVSMLSIV
ncbi:Uncharacterised protein [Mycobacteroides abscessus subsp. abscessus]|nr:Uncharacterised protein [Mycobacteroides abscessus subsp. abscessus]